MATPGEGVVSVEGRKLREDGVRIRWMERCVEYRVRAVRMSGSLMVAMEPVQARRRCFFVRGVEGRGAKNCVARVESESMAGYARIM